MFSQEKERDKLEQIIIAAVIEHPEYAKISSIKPECFRSRFFSKVWKIYQERNIEPFNIIQVLDCGKLWKEFMNEAGVLERLSHIGDTTFGSFSFYEEKLLKMWKRDLVKQRTAEYINEKITESELQKAIKTPVERKLEPAGYQMDEILKAIDKRPRPYDTGFKNLNKHIQFYPSDLIIIKGDTKNGKTTLAMNILAKQLEQGRPCLYVTYEIPTYDRFVSFMSALYINKRYRDKREEQGSGCGVPVRSRRQVVPSARA